MNLLLIGKYLPLERNETHSSTPKWVHRAFHTAISVAVLVGSALFTWSGNANAAILDDFEARVVGPIAGQSPWGDGSVGTVISGSAYQGDKSLLVNTFAGYGVLYQFYGAEHSAMTLSMYVRGQSSDTSGEYDDIHFRILFAMGGGPDGGYGDNNVFVNLCRSGAGMWSALVTDDGIGNDQCVGGIGSRRMDQWARLDMEIKLDTAEARVRLGGSEWSNYVDWGDPQTVVHWVQMHNFWASGDETHIDLMSLSVPASPGVTTRVSVSSSGEQANGTSYRESISDDGRFVVFESDASNLVAGDSNGQTDVFIHDRQTGTTQLVSTASSGGPANGGSYWPDVSADGRYVAFFSNATDILPGGNAASQVFVKDLATGATELISVNASGQPGDWGNSQPSLTPDGRYVAFISSSFNLGSCSTYSPHMDVFVRDRLNGTTECVSVNSAGEPGDYFSQFATISDDGRYVAFSSKATNLVADHPSNNSDVYVHDRQSHITERVSIDSNGEDLGDPRSARSDSFSPYISADGRYVAFTYINTYGTSSIEAYVRDRQQQTTTKVVDVGSAAILSSNGRYLVFQSYATDLVPGDTNTQPDIFVRDLETGDTDRVHVASNGTQANGPSGSNPSGGTAISADGRFVIFESLASNLVAGDTNGIQDLFVHERAVSPPTAQPLLAVIPPASSDFGNVLIGQSSQKFFAARNVGAGTLVGSVSGEGAFSVSPSTYQLGAGQEISIATVFAPTLVGPTSAIIGFDSNGGLIGFEVSGTGVAPSPGIQLSTAAIDFGNQPLGTTSAPRGVTVTNTGAANLSLGVVSISGVNSAEFIISGDSCSNITLVPTGTCSIAIAFAPQALGNRAGTLQVPSNAAGSPAVASLLGAGTALSGGTPPSVRSMSPTSGPAGTPVTIKGHSFGTVQGNGYVEFGSGGPWSRVSAQITSWSDSKIEATAPAGLTGANRVFVGTSFGTGSSDQVFTYPTTVALALRLPPPIKARQDFGLFKPSSDQPRLALLSVASDKAQALNFADECYGGAMSALASAQKKDIIESSLNRLAVDIVEAGLGGITTGSYAGDLLLKVGASAAGAAFLGDSIPQSILTAVTNEAGGYIFSKATSDYLSGVGSLLTDLGHKSIAAALDREDVLPWSLSGSNAGTRYVTVAGLPVTTINANAYYHPWTHYTTVVIAAACQMPGGARRVIYVVTYEQSKGIFGTADLIPSTFEYRSIPVS